MRLILHFLRRILPYDVPLSAAGALLTWATRTGEQGTPAAALITELGIRFAVIACTAGYAFSFLLYSWFGRRELPIYTVAGRHLKWVAGLSCGFVLVGLCALLGISLLLVGWLSP